MSASEADLASAVLARNLKVKKGESVVIEGWENALPYVRAFVKETRRLGANPTVLYEDEQAWWDAAKAKQFGSFEKLSKVERSGLASADVFIYFWGPGDRPRLWDLPEGTEQRLTGSNDEWYTVAGKAGLRGCRMSLGQASDATARYFGLSGKTWRSRLVTAGAEDSAAMRRKGERVAKVLHAGTELRIRHPNGTDLTLQLANVHTRVEVGEVTKEAMKRPFGMLANNPSGQLFVALDDSEGSGTLVSNRPVYMGQHRYSGIRWTFDAGRLTAHALAEGKRAFETGFHKGGKDKDRLGYISIGLNPSARELPPCEDTEEGSVLAGIGNNSFSGGKITEPFQSFALVGEARVEVDGRPVADAGRIK
jgi:leucyl aminopeptidase (aminopeptidase T)